MESLGRARGWLTWILAVEVLAFAASATYLAVFYRPTAAGAWNDIHHLRQEVRWAIRWRAVRRWSAVLAVLTATGVTVLVLTEARARRTTAREARVDGVA